MKTITYALLFAMMDIVPSFVLWVVSPTDSVRVWYPTFIAYAGEHFVAAAGTLFFGWLLLRGVGIVGETEVRYGFTVIRTLVLGSVCVLLDVCASVELGFLQAHDAGVIHLWHTQTLTGYLQVRLPLYVAFAAVLFTVNALCMRRKRRGVTPGIPV